MPELWVHLSEAGYFDVFSVDLTKKNNYKMERMALNNVNGASHVEKIPLWLAEVRRFTDAAKVEQEIRGDLSKLDVVSEEEKMPDSYHILESDAIKNPDACLETITNALKAETDDPVVQKGVAELIEGYYGLRINF